jgi:hypothetical protein
MVKCKIALFLDIVNKEMAFSVLKFGDKTFGIHQARVDAELELGAPRGGNSCCNGSSRARFPHS